MASSPSSSASVTPSASPSVARDDTQVLDLQSVKDMLHISGADHDARIDALIDAATSFAEKYQQRKYLTQTCIDYLDAWPEIIRPQWLPLLAVTTIEYLDPDGVWQTLSASTYTVDTASEPGRIVEAYGQSWPSLRGDINGVKVTYTAGYGTAPDDVPQEIRNALLLLVYDWFYHPDREGDMPTSVKSLLGLERMIGI